VSGHPRFVHPRAPRRKRRSPAQRIQVRQSLERLFLRRVRKVFFCLFVVIYADTMLTQDDMRQPEVAFCLLSGATYTQATSVGARAQGVCNLQFRNQKTRLFGRCYDHNFLRFLLIFGEKICVFLKNLCYNQFFSKFGFVLSQKR
jgi:hypothetical protein